MNPRHFISELGRRNVYKVAVAYAVVGWLLVQVTTQVFPIFEIPNWALRLIVLAIIIGFPIALVIAWAFELTPEGIKHTEDVYISNKRISKNRTWIYVALIGAALSVTLFLIGRLSAPRSSPSPAGVPAKSIAVLPFVNMSADKSDEYLSDGMTEELINVLTKVKGLRVPGRSACFAFKGKNEDDIFHKVGEQLHVNAVLEGSVRRAGEKLRITAQLINVADGYHLWSSTYERELRDVFAMQDEIARAIVGALRVKLVSQPVLTLVEPRTDNIEAYALYLKARYFWRRKSASGLKKCITYFEQALAADPAYS